MARALLRFAFLPALAAMLLAGLCACSSTRERWAQLDFERIAFANLYLSVVDVLDAQGFPVERRDPDQGMIESEWLYGTSVRQIRGPSRRKVLVRIQPSERRPGAFTVAVRVREEVIRKGGMRASRVRESKDWEEWEDNFDDAEFVAAKLRALLSGHVVARGAGDASGS